MNIASRKQAIISVAYLQIFVRFVSSDGISERRRRKILQCDKCTMSAMAEFESCQGHAVNRRFTCSESWVIGVHDA